MPRFAANLSMLFTEHAFLDRFERARACGFEAVEFLFPYEHPIDEIRARLDDLGLRLVLHNLPAGDWNAGERGIACHPDRVEEFRAGVGRAIDCASRLGVPRLNCLAGRVPDGIAPAQARDTLVENLRHAAQRLGDAGLELLLEPINGFDIPGFCLTTSAAAMDVIDAVGAPHLKLQYDVYHMQRSEGELAATIRRLLPRIGHVQIADNPGRHEPGTGEINHRFLFDLLDELGYGGWIGCEYKPAGTTEAGLGWLRHASAPTA